MGNKKRVYFVTGSYNSSLKQYETLEQAIIACDKYNKKAKHKRWVCSGICVGDCKYQDVRKEY